MNKTENLTNEEMLYQLSLRQNNIKPHLKKRDYEKDKKKVEEKTIDENIEHFDTMNNLINSHGGDNYGSQDYFEPGLAYNDIIIQQAVSPETFKHQKEFASDPNILRSRGRPWINMQVKEDQPLVPWLGLRRPQNVPIGDPDQETDPYKNAYSNGEGCWSY